LINRINLEKYQAFAKLINGCYIPTKKEKFWSYLLPLVYPALKPLFNKNKRKEKYYAFKRAFIAASDKMDFWKNVDD
jgi:hypothetical protein